MSYRTTGQSWLPVAFSTVFILVAAVTYSFGQLTSRLQLNKSARLSVGEFCRQNPSAVIAFFDQINLDYPGLDQVRQAVDKKDWPKASLAILDYYQTNGTNPHLRTCRDPLSQSVLTEARLAGKNIFTFQGITDSVPTRANGHLNWFHKGPNNDIEWAYFLNRMGYLESLRTAYCQTGDSTYAKDADRLVIDWVNSNPIPDSNVTNATWRVLEVGLRLFSAWPTAFYGLQQAPSFTPVARLLMLMSLYDQATYVRKFHWVHHNHGVMELNGLTRIALCFPEFKQADEWYKHALDSMGEEFEFQSYPDGSMKELTSSYHWVVVRNFLAYLDLHNTYSKSLPPRFGQIVDNMMDYMVYTARPDGFGLLNNDADLLHNFEILTPLLKRFPRSDWQYVFTQGREGKRPAQTSMLFPWAGHLIMRNGWGETKGKDQYAFFDNGPWGTSHQHNDKLHLSVYANGREILCDAGRMYYKIDRWRQFFNLSASHNVIALDGKGQNRYLPEVTASLADSTYSLQPELDFSLGAYQGGFNDENPGVASPTPGSNSPDVSGRHTRAIIYLKNRYWIVVDQIQTDKPRNLTAYWHFNPACSVITNGLSVRTNDYGTGNLGVVPVTTDAWSVSLIKGQETPYVQGWYSERYNQRVPSYCAEYRTKMSGTSTTFAWILYPSATEKIPDITTHVLPSPAGAFRVVVQIPGENAVELALNMGAIQSIPLSDGYTLTGRCALLRERQPPLVVHGKITNKAGKVVLKR